MKTFSLLLMLSLSSLALADDAAVERYITTYINVMQAQIDKMNDAITLLGNQTISAQDSFNQIGQPSFQAVDDALQLNGFTPNTYYQFAYKNKAEIDEWLKTNTAIASEVSTLEAQRDQLMQDYDQAIKRTATAN